MLPCKITLKPNNWCVIHRPGQLVYAGPWGAKAILAIGGTR